MIRLLVVEDDETLRYVIQDGLQVIIGGYEVLTAGNGDEGIRMWREHDPDIILTDVEMPSMSGFEMVGYIRERDQEIPILFISGCKSSTDVTTGYRLGANNYIKKPFGPEELHAHIQALFKMKGDIRMKNVNNLQKIGSFILDAKHGVLKLEASKTILLTAREAQILSELCLNKGEIIKRNVLLEKFWELKDGYDPFFLSRSLDVMVSKLRKKLKEDPNVKIQVIKGIGIMLVDHPAGKEDQ